MGCADQISWLHAKRRSQLDQHLDRRVARPAFNVADVGAVDPSLEGKVFLAPALGCAQALEIGAKDLANVHAPSIARLSTINLQTISDKRLDCCCVSSCRHVTH